MPVVASSGKPRRKVRFSQNKRPAPAASHRGEAPDARTSAAEGLGLDESDINMSTRRVQDKIPATFKELPVLRDALTTKTSQDQDETVQNCLPFLRGSDGTLRDNLNEFGLSHLFRDRHIEYLYDSLETYPEGFVAMDSSRPWMSYWALAGLTLLGEDVSKYRER